MDPVVRQWQEKCRDVGVDVLCECGGKPVGERTRRPDKITVNELQFADDLAAVTTSRTRVERATSILQGLLKDWGLTMSLTKTKLLVVGSSAEEDLRPLRLDGGEIGGVSDFKYLGLLLKLKVEQ